MSVLIKDMEMPDSCASCRLCFDCEVLRNNISVETATRYAKGRCDDCPLVEVPPHGRLIDADELKKVATRKANELKTYYTPWTGLRSEEVAELIDEAPTVIESEEEQ